MTDTTDTKPDTAADGDDQADTPTDGAAADPVDSTDATGAAPATDVPPVGADGAPPAVAADDADGAPGTPPGDGNRTLTLATLRRNMLAMGVPPSSASRYRPMGATVTAVAMDGDGDVDADADADLVLRVDGPIIDSYTQAFYRAWYGQTVGMDPQTFAEFLKQAAGRAVTLLVNSPGGYVDAGADITSQVQRYSGKVTACVMGDAASMGSCIVCACDLVQVADMGMFMLHAPWGITVGNAVDMREHAKALDVMGDNMATVYAKRMGEAEAKALMADGKDHWFSSADSLANGLADEPMPQKDGDGGSMNDDADGEPADDNKDPMDDNGEPTAAAGTMPAMPKVKGATGPSRNALLHMSLESDLNLTHRRSDHATQI